MRSNRRAAAALAAVLCLFTLGGVLSQIAKHQPVGVAIIAIVFGAPFGFVLVTVLQSRPALIIGPRVLIETRSPEIEHALRAWMRRNGRAPRSKDWASVSAAHPASTTVRKRYGFARDHGFLPRVDHQISPGR